MIICIVKHNNLLLYRVSIPNVLMHGNNQVMPIDANLVPDTDDAVEMYQSHVRPYINLDMIHLAPEKIY